MHENSKLLFRKYALEHFRPGMRVLEIGPDQIPSTYQSIVDDDSLVWHTLDIDPRQEPTYHAESEYSFPIEDGAYDIVLSGQVIEHVRRVWEWIREVARVCRVGGLVITINPVSWPYHEAPVDCWRIYPEGMRALYENAALNVLLSRFESLEGTEYVRHIPGRTFDLRNYPPLMRDVLLALAGVGFPFECAYDTITIGQKTDSPN
jgi:SAM-dependent methyltransferase